jgi:hypothetical protein
MNFTLALDSSNRSNTRVADEVSAFFNFEAWENTNGDTITPDLQSDTPGREALSSLFAFTYHRHERYVLDSCQESLQETHETNNTYTNDWSSNVALGVSPNHEVNPRTHLDSDIFEVPHRAARSLIERTGLIDPHPNSFEAEPIVLSRNPFDQSQSPRSSAADVPKKLKRARITRAARKILEEHFRANPYPDKLEILELSDVTQLQIGTVKTWFCNTRSRNNGTSCEYRLVAVEFESVLTHERQVGTLQRC